MGIILNSAVATGEGAAQTVGATFKTLGATTELAQSIMESTIPAGKPVGTAVTHTASIVSDTLGLIRRFTQAVQPAGAFIGRILMQPVEAATKLTELIFTPVTRLADTFTQATHAGFNAFNRKVGLQPVPAACVPEVCTLVFADPDLSL